MSILKKILILLSVVLFFAAPREIIYAQGERPEFFVTWEAKSYAPTDFKGKVLPTIGSEVNVSFDLIENGAIVDLSGRTIYWYLDDESIKSGEGVKSALLVIMEEGFHDLTIRINNYKGGTLTKKITLPVVLPEVVIETPFLGNQFSGLNLQLLAKPYFFNIKKVSDLSFLWQVNDQPPSSLQNPEVLNINLKSAPPTNTKFDIKLSARNPGRTMEGAARNINLIFVKK
jgi:hypothetical protein